MPPTVTPSTPAPLEVARLVEPFRGLFDRSTEAVIVFDDDGAIIDGNPAALTLFDVTWNEFVARDVREYVIQSPWMPDPAAVWEAFLASGGWSGPLRIRRADGSIRDADLRAMAHVLPGRHMAILRDETERRAAEAILQASEARFRTALEGIRLHAVLLDLDGRIVFMNPYAAGRLGVDREAVVGQTIFETTLPEADRAVQHAAFKMAVATGDIASRWENEWTTASGERIRIDWSSSCVRDAEGAIVGMVSVGEDVTARREWEASQARLIAAIQQTAESIIVTDQHGAITYVNPAFEARSGATAAELMGDALWSRLEGGTRTPTARRLARRIRDGKGWTGEWVLRHTDGTAFREDVTLSPVRDASGAISSFVAVAHDVSEVRALRAAIDETARERAVVAAALAGLEILESPEATAEAICAAMIDLADVDVASVSWFDGDSLEVLGLASPPGYPVEVNGLVPPARAAYLRDRSALGPWHEAWTSRPEDGQYGIAMASTGMRAMAYAPIGHGAHVVGLVVVGTTSESAAARIADRLPAASEFAAAARTLLAGPMDARSTRAQSRARVARIIADGTFHAVFQPIVDMETGRPIGFEALTRFDDGTAPDVMFKDAGAAELGPDLEAATLERAIEGSRDLPSGPWLSLNVSAAFVLERDRLAAIMRRRTRPIILEITEHVPIDDHAAVRAAVAALGPDVRIAVDDAGAGVANFAHIVNLRPDYVKVDAGLIRDVNADLTRQALIVGLRHFARATNGWIIAEGVETEAERVTLRDLSVQFGQGYLFGRPAPAAAWDAPGTPMPLRGMPAAVRHPGSTPLARVDPACAEPTALAVAP